MDEMDTNFYWIITKKVNLIYDSLQIGVCVSPNRLVFRVYEACMN